MQISHASSGEAHRHDRSATILPHLPTAVPIADGVGCIRYLFDWEPDYTGFTVTVLEAAKAKWLFPLSKSHPDGSEDWRHQL